MIDRHGDAVHTWRNDEGQPAVEDDPPTFLRGWNHVELDGAGDLFVTVPLQYLLKLDRESNLIWKAPVSAHHDLAIADDGKIHVLTESPKQVKCDDGVHTILDQLITVLEPSGALSCEFSLFDVLRTDGTVSALMDRELVRRHGGFDLEGWAASPAATHSADEAAEVRELLETGTCPADRTRALRLLRRLPGSPCDVLHANTVDILGAHPRGLWRAGDVLVSLRSLDLVAVLDLREQRVVWAWGDGELSGQHQPSMTPDGNIILMDNGVTAGRSRLVEVEPAEKKIVWQYVTDPPEDFYTPVAGGCEVLPDGNILVTQAQSGRAFEITRDGDVVWEWNVNIDAAEKGAKVSRVKLYRLSPVRPGTAGRILSG